MSIFVNIFRIFFLSLKLHYTLSSCFVVFVVKLEIVACPALSNTNGKHPCHHDFHWLLSVPKMAKLSVVAENNVFLYWQTFLQYLANKRNQFICLPFHLLVLTNSACLLYGTAVFIRGYQSCRMSNHDPVGCLLMIL